jgi:large conductance mechanosensitive channel
MGLLKEFKEFAVKGNLVDIAVGFVMGATFTKIVTSFVDGMVMPLVGMLTGGVDFSHKVFVLKEATSEVKDAAGQVVTAASEAIELKYGAFITNLIDFLIIAFVVFMIIKAINRLKLAAPPPPPPGPTTTDQLLTEIRDALKK